MGLLGRRIVEKPWTVVAADIVGPLPRLKSKNQCMPIPTLNKYLINRENRITRHREVGRETNRLKIIKDEVQKNLELANERQAKYYNLRRRPISYEIGEQVLRSEKSCQIKEII